MSDQVDAVGWYLTAVQQACHVLNHQSAPSEVRHARRALARVAPRHYLLPILAHQAPDLSTHVTAFRYRAVNAVLGTAAAILATAFIQGLGLFGAALGIWFEHFDRETAQISGGQCIPER